MKARSIVGAALKKAPEESLRLESERRLRVKAIIVFVLILLALSVFSYIKGHPSSYKSDVFTYSDFSGVNVVEATMNPYGHYIVEGEINGHSVTFIVDTGASFIAIPEAVANEIGLAKGDDFMAKTAGGYSKAYSTDLESVSIGTISKADIQAAITTESTGEFILLGMNFLYDLSLEQKTGKLIIKQ